MKIERSKAVAVCQAVGLKNADQWDNSRMASKMESIPDLNNIETLKKGIKDKEVKNMLEAVLGALEEEKDITVVPDPRGPKGAKVSSNGKPKAVDEDDDESEDEEEDSDDDEETESSSDDDEEDDESEEEEEEEEKPVKKGKDKKGKKPEKAKAKKAKKEPVAKDWFGNWFDKRTHKINKVLTVKPMTLKKIEELSKATSVNSHLNSLLKKGFIDKVKDDNGIRFVLSKKGAKLKAK